MSELEVLKIELQRLREVIAMRNRQIKDLRRLIKQLRGDNLK